MFEKLKRQNQLGLSLQAVITLTEWSERTIRRRVADGGVRCVNNGVVANKILIAFDSIESDICIKLSVEHIELIKQADAGNVDAQNDVALLFLSRGKTKSALYWLELAAKQNHPDAMHWLGLCYMRGEGVTKDLNLAMMWIAKAASKGHAIALAQMKALSTA